jgi:zona occludens toxin
LQVALSDLSFAAYQWLADVPIIVHFGNPRQGKSYAAVADHIVPALAKGRRVVTNIEGMGDEGRRELLQAKVERINKAAPPIDLHFVPHSQLERESIFPVDTKQEDADGTRVFDDSQSVVKFGTMIVWDEARSFTTGNLPAAWHEALTYHGHWARGGSTVDIVLIHQNWKSLAPLVRSTAETVYEFVKRASGKGYRRYTFASPGDRELSRRAKETLEETFTYDPEIFALYKTNADEGPTNDNIAVPFWKTQYFKSRIRFIVVALAIGVAGLAYGIHSIMNTYGAKEPSPVGQVAHVETVAPVAELPRIVGKLPTGDGVMVIVQDGDRYETIPVREGRVIYQGEALTWPSDF